MKILKNNWWNRRFHLEKLTAQYEKYRESKLILLKYGELFDKVCNCTSLLEMLDLHKEIWNAGFTNKNIGPCEWGCFRTESIPTMRPEEVFLGNIYGIWTHNIPYWEEHMDEKYGINNFGLPKDVFVYDIICKHYGDILKSNMSAIKNNALDYITEYESINMNEDD